MEPDLMAYETLQDVLGDIDRRGPLAHSGQRLALCVFIAHTMIKADEAWRKLSETHDDLEDAYQRGRSHALCEILGDQEALARMLDRKVT
jgi:hypothetical protein